MIACCLVCVAAVDSPLLPSLPTVVFARLLKVLSPV